MNLISLLPLFAAAVAVVFWLGYRRTRGYGPLIGAAVWALYALYEAYMSWLWNPPGVPLRLDVLFLWPALAVVSGVCIVWSLIGFFLGRWEKPRR